MIRRFALVLLLLLTVPALAQPYTALLSGVAEVPGPGDADGTGMAVVTIDGTTLRYNVWAQNIGAPTGAHIHSGGAGASGGVFVGLDHNSLASGAVPITAEQAGAIRANPAGFYLNVHTAEFPNGAVRGQLVAAPTGEGNAVSYIPVVGKVRGQSGTNFVTDLRIINNGASAATVTLDYFGATTASKQVTVFPGEQRVLDDVVGTTLGLENGLGGLRITATQNVVASARIINDLRSSGAGTAGFAVEAASQGSTSGTIAFLSSTPDFRTNLGYFNPNPSAATLNLTARRSIDGAVFGTGSVSVPANGMVQSSVFSLISAAAADQVQDDYYITWTATAPIFVYGAVTDNKTGDAVLNQ